MSSRGSELPPPHQLEAVLALPAQVNPARNVRSTLIYQSIANVRAAGLFDPWLAEIPLPVQPALVDLVPGGWLPMSIALAHYSACDALGLTPDKLHAMGKATLDRVGTTIVGTMSQMARQPGVTPWTFFPNVQRYWQRGFDGGAVGIYVLGERDARLDVVGCPLVESTFFRGALRGWLSRLIEPFCEKVFVNEHRATARDAAVLRAHWA